MVDTNENISTIILSVNGLSTIKRQSDWLKNKGTIISSLQEPTLNIMMQIG